MNSKTSSLAWSRLLKGPPVEELGLERREEALDDGVVEGVTATSDRLQHAGV
jgi:hypothetical protein